MRVIVSGGGVIGACSAYYLSRRGAEVTVFERAGVANAASGKSGGFLALDWCDGTRLEALARRSYALHAELATAGLGEWGYRAIDTLSVIAADDHGYRGRLEQPSWLSNGAAVLERIGTPSTTAQIDPAAFTRGIMRAAEANGAVVRAAAIENIAATSVHAGGTVHEADFIVIALGPWSHLASRWLGMPAIYGLKGQSVIYTPSPVTEPMNFFLEYQMESGERLSPEIVPRPDGTLYACGLSYEDPVPLDPGTIGPDEAIQAKLQHMVGCTIPALRGMTPAVTQACYRPVTVDGLPLLGRHPDHPRGIVATGHSVWGMLNGPATGEAVAQLILDGTASTVSIAAFDPARLPFA